jgi:hypothetical protein
MSLPQTAEPAGTGSKGQRKLLRAWQKAKLELAPQLDELFLKLLNVRRTQARNAGCDSFRDLIWLKYPRYDYSPEDCYEFHRNIGLEVVPLATEYIEYGLSRLGALQLWQRSLLEPEQTLHRYRSALTLETPGAFQSFSKRPG